MTDALPGRDRELTTLLEMVDGAIGGGGRLVAVTGEAGIGKTRVCEALTDLAHGRGLSVAWAACWDAQAVPALWAPRQALSQLGVEVDLAGSRDGEGPDEARAVLFDEVARRLRVAAGEQPLLLVVDDVQWADVASLLLLAHLAPLLRTMAVLLVVTVREEAEVGPALVEVLRRASRVRLSGLAGEEVGALIASVTGRVPSAAVTDALCRLTGGNPLFATELARRLHDDDGLGRLLDGDIAVPATVRAVLDLKLRALDDGCLALLRVVAVVGREAGVDVLSAVTGLERAAVVAAVDGAVVARVLAPAGVGRYAFTHPLLRAALLDDMGVAARVGMHQRVAEVLEASPAPDVAALAFHYLAAAPAGSVSKAVDYAAAAADAAMSALAYEDAGRLYRQALDVASIDPASCDRVPLLLGFAAACASAGDVDRARGALLDAADLARRAGSDTDLAAAALGFAGGGFEVALFDDDQVALLEESLTRLGASEPLLRSRLSARLSVALSLAGHDERRVALSDDAVRLASEAGGGAALAHALAARCDVHAGPADVERRRDDSSRIVDLGAAAGDVAVELLGRRLRVVAALEAGDLAAAERDIRAFARVADRLGQARYGWYGALWRATILAARGRLREQAAVLDDAETLGRRARSANVEVLALSQRWLVWIEEGDVETAAARYEEMLPPNAAAELGVQVLPALALHRILDGRPEEAAAVLDGITADLRTAPVDSEWLPMIAQVADACGLLQGHPLAGWAYESLAPHAGRWSVEGIGAYVHGPVDRHLGVLAAVLGDREAAAVHFDAAEAILRQAGAGLLLGRAQLERGRWLGDTVALQAARDTYGALGVHRRVAEVETMLDAAGPPTKPGAAGGNVFRRQGDVWVVHFGGRATQVRDSKGMRDLGRLLAAPGRSIAAVDLADATGRSPRDGDLGEVVDATARAAYKQRLADLEAELDDTDRTGDIGRSSALVAERDALVAQLAGAYGLGGRARRTGGTAERARTTVTSRIRDALRRLDEIDPDLGRHLDRSVRTGAFCVYDPDVPTTWES